MKTASKLLIVYILLLSFRSYAQQPISKTKTITQSISAEKLNGLLINTEKSDIHIKGSEEDEIKYEITITCTHTNESQVEVDLNKVNLVNETFGKSLFLRTFFAIQKGEQKPKSKYDITYNISIPKKLNVLIVNSLGKNIIENIYGNIELNTRFCDNQLLACEGKIKGKTEYGKTTISKPLSEIEWTGGKTNLVIRNPEGELKIIQEYGSLLISNPKSGDIETVHTDITIRAKQKMLNDWILKTTDTKVQTPPTFKPRKRGNKTDFELITGKKNKILIQSKYGSLNIL